MLAVQLALVGTANAAPPGFLFQAPATTVEPGEGAGELDNPRGMAASSANGRTYIADLNNARISEYTAWGRFVKAWGWGVEDGSSELQTCGPVEPEEDPDPTLCEAGDAGSGKGQLNLPLGVAVEAAGDVYVFELGNLRVQKFSPAGAFLLMFGGDVNKTKVEAAAPAAQRNRCPVDPGDVCQAGVSGEEPSQFSGTVGNYIAYSPAESGRIAVGDKGGIQVFDLNGNWIKTIAFSGELSAFADETIDALDVDEAGNAYFSLSGLEDIFKISPAGAPLAPGKPGASSFEVGNPSGVAVDVQGGVYAVDAAKQGIRDRIFEFDAIGKKLLPTKAEEDAEESFPFIPFQGPAINGIATNFCASSEEPGSLYASFFTSGDFSYINAYGTPPIGCEAPPLVDPEVTEQFASAVGREEATVKAKINPRFWPDATYEVEYGTGKCPEGGCPSKAPVPAALLTSRSLNAEVTTAGVILEDLEPGTVYHYRFVAQSGGGGPVYGIDPDGIKQEPGKASFEEGQEGTFATFAAATPVSPCANDPVRIGPSKELPDCRAYEMVSPIDKAGGDVALWRGRNATLPEFQEVHISAPAAERFTYSSSFAFAEPQASPYMVQYLAERGLGGWSSKAISAVATLSPSVGFVSDFDAFSEDLCQGWMLPASISILAPGAILNYRNLYRRDNCAEPPSYEALSTAEPLNRTPEEYKLMGVRGFSEDGTHTAFATNGQLQGTDAPDLEGTEPLLYESTGGQVRFVCYLPSGTPNLGPCAAGAIGGEGDSSNLRNVVSDDGSRIFWSALEGTPTFLGIPGQVYVRIDGTETRDVSTTVDAGKAWYWTASEDGSKAVFAFAEGPHKDELYELDVDTGTPTLIAGEVDGPMGASEDASRIYFSGREDLDGGGPATAGEHNLYLYEADPGGGGGEFSFVMELAAEDTAGTADFPAPIEEIQPRSARVSADGLHAVFTSVASPTPSGYDNLDANSGEPAQEVYQYDAVSRELRCVSCNPTGARPVGVNIWTTIDPFYVAAKIQGWELFHHAPRVLSDDGSRVFFESHEALEPRDTNGTWDVYQWEEEGQGSCTASTDSFSPDSGGCVELISSGLSSAKSTFLDADATGNNVFIGTHSSLVPRDPGLSDAYVARVGGGFPEAAKPVICEGDACQSPPPPPPGTNPASRSASGPGNVPQAKRKARRCPKGKRRVKRGGKVRCVKRKAATSRRAGR